MDTIEQIETRRDAVLEEIRSIRSLKRGSITQQYLDVPHQGKKKPVRRGPYYVFSRRENDRTVSHRLRTPEEVEQTRQDIARFERFKALCLQLEQLTERLGDLQRRGDPEEAKKKRIQVALEQDREVQRIVNCALAEPQPDLSASGGVGACLTGGVLASEAKC